jgi:Insertion element 4 transposase N-terminal/Transposase DDE domain
LDTDCSIPAATRDTSPPPVGLTGLGLLNGFIPPGLIDEVLAHTGRAGRRLRRLPGRVVVWFVLACALYAGEGYRSVWRNLAGHAGIATGRGAAPTSAAFVRARRRLGVSPLAALFGRLRGPQAPAAAPWAFVAGLRLVAWDATMLDVPDTPANTAAFISSGNKRGRGAFPKVRLLALIEVGTHAVIDAVFGHASEQVLARRLLPALDKGMLLVGDRAFPSYRLWRAAADTGAQLLWRVKASTHLPRIGGFPDGSALAVLPVPGRRRSSGIWVRVIDYRVTVTAVDPATSAVSTRSEQFRLVTTITDPQRISAAALAHCYRQRWESETGYKSLKTHQRGPRAVLRSQDPDGVNQEIYAYLITYQAVQHLRHQAAASAALDPDRLSFTSVLRVVRRAITTTITQLGHALTDALEVICEDRNQRRPRQSPRVVKRSQTPYPAKRHAAQQASTTVTYTIHIDHHTPT